VRRQRRELSLLDVDVRRGRGVRHAHINRCRCVQGYSLIEGNCLDAADTAAFCGTGHHFDGKGCALDQCRAGDELDQSTGLCIPHEQVNKVASNLGVTVGQGQKLGCPAGQKLILDGQNAACVPLSQTCARDETWNGQACVKPAPCAQGATWDSAQNRCIEYVVVPPPAAPPEEPKKIDVAQWAAAHFGPNGGNGAAAFCGGFSKKPFLFGLSEGQSVTVKVGITMTFADGDIAKGAVSTLSVYEHSSAVVSPKGAMEVDAAAKGVLAPLLKGGGRATVAAVETTVKCSVVSAAKPVPVPSGGL
jgi:hypothetical protein